MATTEDVKKLREETGVSIMQCKKALEEADGDSTKAKEILKEISASVAAKKSDRELGSGVAQAYTHSNGSVVGAVVLMSETDFVAKNNEFAQLAYDIAMHVAAMNPQVLSKEQAEQKGEDISNEEVLLEQAFVKDPSKTIRQLIEEATQKFGEKVELERFERLSV